MRLAVFFVMLVVTPMAWAVQVTTQSVQSLAVFPAFSAPASVIALNNSAVSAEVAGVVREVHVQVGQRVKQGDVLASVDDFIYQQALIQAQSSLTATAARIELAQYQLEQAKRLGLQNNVSAELLATRKAELTSLLANQQAQQAGLAMAERNLIKTQTLAPFDGVVTARFAQLGMQLDPGKPVVNLVGTGELELSAQLSGADALLIPKARDLIFKWQGGSFPVRLRAVTRVMNQAQRTQDVRLMFVDQAALAGSSGRLHWQSAEPFLPAKILVQRDGQLGVFVADNKQARFVVLPSAQEGRSVALGSLADDALVIVDGRYSLQDGDSVELAQ